MDEQQFQTTIDLIGRLHEGQIDSLGNPYCEHPIRVANNLIRIFPDATDDEIQAALLHDTIEDCGISEDFLRQKGFSENCIAIIRLVSKPKDDRREYSEVIDDLIASGNLGAMRVKLADNADNLHPERVSQLQTCHPEKALRLEARYRSSVHKLSVATGMDVAHVTKMISCLPSVKSPSLEWHP